VIDRLCAIDRHRITRQGEAPSTTPEFTRLKRRIDAVAEFVVNQSVTTDQPVVEVTVSASKPLPLGRHRFRLVVVDDSGNRSAPDEVEVIVADRSAPTAVLNAPKVVDLGQRFNLDGSKSFDVGGGRVVQWVWTYLGPP
jgi:hypothetical protein